MLDCSPAARSGMAGTRRILMAMAWTRITIEPEKMNGRACIRGLRMPVATVVRMVASGMTFDEIVEAHPELERADITEALEYAASLADAQTMPLRRTGS